MKESELIKIAEKEGLDYIETTSESIGVPLNIRGGIIGFDSFEELQELVEKYSDYNWKIIAMSKKEDSDYWTRNGTVYREFENGAEDYGDENYQQIPKMGEEEFIGTQIYYTGFFTNFELVFPDNSISQLIQIVAETKIAFYQDKNGYIEVPQAIEALIGSKGYETFEEITDFLQNKLDIYNEVEKMDDDQLVITYDGKYFDTIDKHSMHFENPLAHFVIGLI